MRTADLGSLASISMGYSFRSGTDADVSGDISVVQLRNIQGDGTLDVTEMVQISRDKVKPSGWLKSKDIVFCSRGVSMLAALVPADIGKAIAAAPVLVIRLTSEVIDPGYLVWFLNHPSLGQRYLAPLQLGSTVTMVRRAELSAMQILVPPLATQSKISALLALQRKENSLLKQLQEKRDRYMNAVLMKLVQGELS